MRSSAGALAVALLAVSMGGGEAQAAGPPQVGDVWATEVVASSAGLHAEITPNGSPTGYRFDYITAAAYEANIAGGHEGFAGATRIPAGEAAPIGSGPTAVGVSRQPSSLAPETAYRYRVVASSSVFGTTVSAPFAFTTQGLGGGASLPDGRGWEMVSPVDKNGGQADPAGADAGGGVLQAAADGDSVTYGSSASFGEDAAGAPAASQYISRRGAGAWATEDVTVPLLAGSYGSEPDGVPYQLFSPDLARGLLLNGNHCRGEGEGCAVPNPPLAGTDAPTGYQNYYLRDSATGGFRALLGAADLTATPLSAARFDLRFAGASPDLSHIVLSTCAALTAAATEAPGTNGCDPGKPNLYERSGAGLSSVNLLPGETLGTPGAALAAQSGAVSGNGLRVYFTHEDEVTHEVGLYLREGESTKLVSVGGEFQTASADGSLAFFTRAGHLYRYDAASEASGDLTPAGGVQGVFGASEDGAYVYYLTAAGLFLRHGVATTEVAASADSGSYPPTTGTARVSADGTRLAFTSTASLTGYDNIDATTFEPDAEVYLYDAGGGGGAGTLACVSCNPTNGRPVGPSSIPGATGNGKGPDATHSYKPRALSADGRRLFFDSRDALVLGDTNRAPDVYEWEAQGTGGCRRQGGCLGLISSGKGEGGASFVDASSEGSDIFFLTDRSLVRSDPGSVDLYDAREGGGFPAPSEPIVCEGDDCQGLPSEPEDQAVNTLIPGAGNPPVRYVKVRHRKHRHKRTHPKRQRQRAHRDGRGRS